MLKDRMLGNCTIDNKAKSRLIKNLKEDLRQDDALMNNFFLGANMPKDYPYECELEGFAGIKCGRSFHSHHLINRSKAKKGTKAYKALDAEELKCIVCDNHNAHTKSADWPSARRILLLKKIERYGADHMRELINGIPWKVPFPEMSFEAILIPD